MLLLHEILKDWPCTFIGDTFKVPILGVTEHSKRVKPGYLFIARKGEHEDGIAYIEEAIRKGAVAVVIDRMIERPFSVPLVVVASSERFLSYASARLAGNPSERLTVVAITGTNGKTTVAHYVTQLLKAVGVKVATFGTLGVFIDGQPTSIQSPHMTTLPAEYLHPALAKCEARGVTHIVMEASSLGLSTERLTDCHIDIGVLLNISEDHYEEHGSEEAYIEAKKRLINMAQHVIVNCDDKKCRQIARSTNMKKQYFGKNEQASFRLMQQKGKTMIKTPTLVADLACHNMAFFNQLNILAAISILDALSYQYEAIEGVIPTLTLPKGRMEEIEVGGVKVIVDYAHTPDALETVLQSLFPCLQHRLILVFGCGGNRDHGKRPKMGAIAAGYASEIIITSDNPRDEDPNRIVKDIVQGIPATIEPYIEIDRKKAIQQAVTCAQVGDIVVIAGKGHEQTQQIGQHTYPFSDQAIAEHFLMEKYG